MSVPIRHHGARSSAGGPLERRLARLSRSRHSSLPGECLVKTDRSQSQPGPWMTAFTSTGRPTAAALEAQRDRPLRPVATGSVRPRRDTRLPDLVEAKLTSSPLEQSNPHRPCSKIRKPPTDSNNQSQPGTYASFPPETGGWSEGGSIRGRALRWNAAEGPGPLRAPAVQGSHFRSVDRESARCHRLVAAPAACPAG